MSYNKGTLPQSILDHCRALHDKEVADKDAQNAGCVPDSQIQAIADYFETEDKEMAKTLKKTYKQKLDKDMKTAIALSMQTTNAFGSASANHAYTVPDNRDKVEALQGSQGKGKRPAKAQPLYAHPLHNARFNTTPQHDDRPRESLNDISNRAIAAALQKRKRASEGERLKASSQEASKGSVLPAQASNGATGALAPGNVVEGSTKGASASSNESSAMRRARRNALVSGNLGAIGRL